MRIAFIGAGSVEFTRKLVGDILGFAELRDITLALHDIDAERLDTAERIVRWVSDERGARVTVEAHIDRRRALDGADFVLNMIQVGGHDATLIDFDIPERYGLRQTIGDTLGIGGIFRALRTIPVMHEFGAEMSELCADAWLLNYTNPMAMNCWAMYDGTAVTRTVGLCHSVQGTVRDLAAIVDVPLDEVDFLSAGVNHQAFLLSFERGGENLYPLLDEAIERDDELARRFRMDVYRRFGYFPTESSEHLAEYVPWVMNDDDAIAHYRTPVREYVRRSEEHLAEYAQLRADVLAGRSLPAPEQSVEYASQIIHSIATGQPRTFYGNVKNTGLIDNLPDGACVEVPCKVDAAGVRPVAVGALPPQLAALNRTYLNVVELVVHAVLERNPLHVRHAAMLDPNTAATLTPEAIWQLCDDLVAAHGDALPRWLREPQPSLR